MGDGLDWQFKLDDLTSGPATQMSEAVDGFNKRLETSNVALRQMREQQDRLRGSMDKLDETVRKVNPARTIAKQLKDEEHNVLGPHGWLGQLADGSLFSRVADKVPELYFGTELAKTGFEIGEGLFHATEGVVHFVAEQANMKKQTLISMEALTGSTEQAKKYYDFIQKFSDLTPFTQEVTQETFQGLLGLGLDFKTQIVPALSMIADLGTGGGQGQMGIQRMIWSLQEMYARGKVDYKHLGEFAAASGGLINAKNIYADIAKERGVSVEAAAGLLRSGEFTPDQFMRLLEEETNRKVDQGKGLGTHAIQQGVNLLPGQLSTLKNRFDRLFQDVDTSPLTDALTNLNAILGDMNDNTSPLKATFDEMFTNLFGEYRGVKGKKLLESDIKTVVQDVGTLVTALEKLTHAAAKVTSVGLYITDAVENFSSNVAYDIAKFSPAVLDDIALKNNYAKHKESDFQKGSGAYGFMQETMDYEAGRIAKNPEMLGDPMVQQLLWNYPSLGKAVTNLNPSLRGKTAAAALAGRELVQHISVHTTVIVPPGADPNAVTEATKKGVSDGLSDGLDRAKLRGGG